MKMLTYFSTIALCSVVGFPMAWQLPQKRAEIKPLGQIFAYGANITGLPVFVAEGTAYIGNVTLSPISGASNVTFEELGGEILIHHQHTNSSGTSTGSNETFLAIDTTTGASKPVLIAGSTAKEGYTTEGFYIYGTQIVWKTSDGTIKANFYAQSTDVDNVWDLYWDASSTASSKGTLVVLKALPPPRLQ